jgi:HAMP domain-containing protein/DNA-directed RNA polymerase subunit RPC12/RpoP
MDRKRMPEDDRQAQGGSGAGMTSAERQVIIICEECGKKYSVVPSRIPGSSAGFTCRRCGHQIVVERPSEALPGGAARENAVPPPTHRKSPGLRAEMVIIVLVFPLLVMIGAVFIFLQQMQSLVSDLDRQCSQTAGQRIEERVPGASAAASVEESAGPAIPTQNGISAFNRQAGIAAALILGGAFLIVLLVVLFFGLRLAGRVRTLAAAAARINKGDLAAEIETDASDELGILAEAVNRLRENLRSSRERMSL